MNADQIIQLIGLLIGSGSALTMIVNGVIDALKGKHREELRDKIAAAKTGIDDAIKNAQKAAAAEAKAAKESK